MSVDPVSNEEMERKRVQRIATMESALRRFKSHFETLPDGHQLFIRPTAHKDIGNTYFTLHEEIIRPHIEKYSSCFKMASLTEHVITLVQPFEHADGRSCRHANAVFAFSVALCIMDGMDQDGEINHDGIWDRAEALSGSLTAVDEALSRMVSHKAFYTSLERSVREHVLWLETRNGKDAFPILHNATFLDLLWYSLHYPFQATP